MISHNRSSTRPAFVVLNPGGRDADQFFPDGAPPPSLQDHAPINYHAYAACMRGSFLRSPALVPDEASVLLLLRKDLRPALRAIPDLVKKRTQVFVSWKEAGLHQVSTALAGKNQWQQFQEICGCTSGAIASTPELSSLYRAAGSKLVAAIPTPYPVGEPGWDFSIPFPDRSGIFLGTRELDVPSRNHLLCTRIAAAAAARLGTTVTMIDDGSAPRWMKASLLREGFHLVKGPLPYPDYLRLIARHRVLFQLDRSAVPGQVAGDCLLAGVLCVGGDGSVEREVFSESCGFGKDTSTLEHLLMRALSDDEWLKSTEQASREAAHQRVSFPAIASRIQNLLSQTSI